MEIDNQAAICHVANEDNSARFKHMDIKLKFSKDCAKKGIVKPTFLPTEEMSADLLAKSLSAVRQQRSMGLCSLIRTTTTNEQITITTREPQNKVPKGDMPVLRFLNLLRSR